MLTAVALRQIAECLQILTVQSVNADCQHVISEVLLLHHLFFRVRTQHNKSHKCELLRLVAGNLLQAAHVLLCTLLRGVLIYLELEGEMLSEGVWSGWLKPLSAAPKLWHCPGTLYSVLTLSVYNRAPHIPARQ